MSEAYVEIFQQRPDLEIISEPDALKFNGENNLFKCNHHPPGIFFVTGNQIRVYAPAKIVAGKKRDQIVERNNALFGADFKPGSVPNVLFRTEEIHGRSGIGNIFPFKS